MKTQIIKNKTQILNNQLVIVDKDLNSFYVRNLYIFSEGKYKLSLSAGMLNSENLTSGAMLVKFLLKIKKSIWDYMNFFDKKNNKRLGIIA